MRQGFMHETGLGFGRPPFRARGGASCRRHAGQPMGGWDIVGTGYTVDKGRQ